MTTKIAIFHSILEVRRELKLPFPPRWPVHQYTLAHALRGWDRSSNQKRWTEFDRRYERAAACTSQLPAAIATGHGRSGVSEPFPHGPYPNRSTVPASGCSTVSCSRTMPLLPAARGDELLRRRRRIALGHLPAADPTPTPHLVWRGSSSLGSRRAQRTPRQCRRWGLSIDTFVARGFSPVSLGAPILRVEAAVAAALGQLLLLGRLGASEPLISLV
jgi:hypothetical protein